MAQQILTQPQFVRGGPGNFVVEAGGSEEPWIKETASQTYKAGDLVYFDSNGTIAICGNTGSKLNTAILGQAIKDATGTTGAAARLRIIRPGDVYAMNLYHATIASAVGTDATVGAIFGVILDSGSHWTVDLANAVEGSANTLGRVRVVGYPNRGPDGTANTITDTYAWVYVQFLEFSLDLTDSNPLVRVLQYH